MKRLMAAGVLGLVVLSACGGNGDEQPTPNPNETAATESPGTATSSPSVESSPAPFDLPRAGVWGGVEIEVLEAQLANVVPTTFHDPDPEPSDVTSVFVTIRLGFQDGYPAPSTDFDISSFALAVDEQSTPATSTDFSSTILLGGGEQLDVTLAFDAGDRDLGAAALVYDDRAHVPVSIALTGPPTETVFPLALELDAESADVNWKGGCADATGTVEPLRAEFDLDDGIDHDGDPVQVVAPHRASNGERFVRITVQTIAGTGTCGGSLPGDDQFRLFADGLPLGPINADSELLKDGEGFEFIWGFAIPADVSELTLEVGTATGTTASFPIPVPEDLA